jgi:AcrR family transcriptional regulator
MNSPTLLGRAGPAQRPHIVAPMKPATSQRRTEILDAAATVFESEGIRASITDIAAACGVLTGSLYHHFDSKEAIVVELVERYVLDLEHLAGSVVATDIGGGSALGAVERFGTAIAECAIRHRAALLLSFHEPPRSYGPELARLARRVPVEITRSMRTLLDRAHDQGLLRDGIDRGLLADRLCQNMIHVGIGAFHRQPQARQVPALRCRMLLEGIAAVPLIDAVLDSSNARHAADEVIGTWPPAGNLDSDAEGRVLAAARTEFGRRGYEATTVRDVATAAGTSTKAVYRLVTSKEDLLWKILVPYANSLVDAWDAVLTSDATPLEKLDALLWLDINILERFNEENNIISVFMQFAPPSRPDLEPTTPARSSDLDVPFASQLRKVRSLLGDGERLGELRFPLTSADVRARCVFALIWTPHNIIAQSGRHAAHAFARATLLQGAARP